MTGQRSDAGFTLIELLVVLVIMPLVIGAIAAAIIVSEEDSGVASGRLVDSSNAQIASEYYIRDVQGAQYVTTANIAGHYSVASPQVCVNPALTSPTPVLGLYRPANATPPVPALSVGYWQTTGPGAELVRDSCSVNSSGMTSFIDQVLISDDISPGAVSVLISGPPNSTFATDATSGWTETSSSGESISSITLSVAEPDSSYVISLQATPRIASSSTTATSG